MPANGNEIIIRIQPDGTILDQYGHHLVITAVPIPSHGRLVDETKLIPDGGYIIADGMVCVPVKCINDVPTVIPAEEEE